MNSAIQIALSYDDVLLIPQYSDIESRNDVDTTTKITSKIVLKTPILSANMSDVTGTSMAIEIGRLGGLGILPRFTTPENQADQIKKVKEANVLVGAAIGIRSQLIERSEILLKAGADILVLDVAHGHMKKTLDAVKIFKDKFPKEHLIAGNVATEEAAAALFEAGADCVKVGIGPGSICTTRIETGSGVPQITAILSAAKAARKYKKTLIADGGTKNSGDIVKGLAAGASAIMAGGQIAGTKESPGKLVFIGGKRYKTYNASTSLAEKNSHLSLFKPEIAKHYTMQIEGVESVVPYKGPLAPLFNRMQANIKSGFSYSGAKNLEELWKKAKFIQITAMGRKESEAHDVIVTS